MFFPLRGYKTYLAEKKFLLKKSSRILGYLFPTFTMEKIHPQELKMVFLHQIG